MRNVLLMCLALAAALAWMQWRDPLFPPTREIVVVAKNMQFTVPSENAAAANPVIRGTSGERITFVFRNADAGTRHNLAIPAIGLNSRILSPGQSQRLTVTLPTGPTNHEYHCAVHQRMMNGRIIVSLR